MQYSTAKNTLRFQVKKPEEMRWSRSRFVKEIVFGLLRLDLKDILCLQDYERRGLFDLTLMKEDACWEKKGIFEESTLEIAREFYLEPIFTLDWKTFHVRMNSAQVPEEEIKSYFERFFVMKHGLVKVLDSAGIWNTWRKFYGRFKMEKRSGTEVGLKPVFYIGPNKGIIRYVGQPEVCYKCSAADHYAAECTATVCRNCNKVGHTSKDCGEGKVCNLCGSTDHLYKDCGKRVRSYAEAAAGGKERSQDKEKFGAGVPPPKQREEPEKQQFSEARAEKQKEKSSGTKVSVGGGTSMKGGGMAGKMEPEQTKERGGDLGKEEEKKGACSLQEDNLMAMDELGFSGEDSMEGKKVAQKKRKQEEEEEGEQLTWAEKMEIEEEKKTKEGSEYKETSNYRHILMQCYCKKEFQDLMVWNERLRKGSASESELKKYKVERDRILQCARWRADIARRGAEKK